MMNGLKYIFFRIQKKLLKNKNIKHTAYGKKVLDIDEGNRTIEKFLKNDEPCFIARIGSVEMQAINSIFNVEAKLQKNIPDIVLQTLYNNAGFFPKTTKSLLAFFELYCREAKNIDIAAMLMNRDEDYFYHNYSNIKHYLCLNALEPYYSKNPWTRVLKNKKVLVINPFSETIKKQYKNRDKLFEDENILPKFDLITFKSVQSIGNNTEGYNTWFEALNDMKKKISNIDFDIAIVGCGAYSFPLGSYIKSIGKKSIIMGGATQILFGIKGTRWDNHPKLSKLYNEYWVRPDSNEIPKGAEKVEGGCYW